MAEYVECRDVYKEVDEGMEVKGIATKYNPEYEDAIRGKSDVTIGEEIDPSTLGLEFVPGNCKFFKLEPFGLLIRRIVGEDEDENTEKPVPVFKKQTLIKLGFTFRFVICKGWKSLEPEEFIEFASHFGYLVEWNFGPILQLIPQHKASNFVMSYEGLPIHWDLMLPPEYIEERYGVDAVCSYQLFQCVKAPTSEEGGRTTFVNTTKLLEQASDEQIEEWENTRLTYSLDTEYFGGKDRTYAMVSEHPLVKGKKIFRFHPPWESQFNPVHVKSYYKNDEELNSLLDKNIKLLFNKDYYVEYNWEDGDLFFSDNSSCLHGRTPIDPNSFRHVMRIQIMHSPKLTYEDSFLQDNNNNDENYN
eukprot:TRINITY_DN3310_c0_g1_i1.p1 TRINITY_DN3310_c0_g1~~TRINITY_DN3310_c0_g1_i1.p1  ORF type:complete len:370 (-),score=137.63 TRINITY_DN3310_c0_g1_i1:180-1259(-)